MYYLGFSVELTCDTSNNHAWKQPSLNCLLWTQTRDQSCIYNHGSFLDLTALAGLVCGVGCEDPKLPLASHGALILVWREREKVPSNFLFFLFLIWDLFSFFGEGTDIWLKPSPLTTIFMLWFAQLCFSSRTTDLKWNGFCMIDLVCKLNQVNSSHTYLLFKFLKWCVNWS